MATFATGNEAWDQGLGALSSSLFPDPSKVASAGYYGAKQREAQVTTDQVLLERQKKQQLFEQMQQMGGGVGSAGLPQPGVPAQNQPSTTAAPGGAPQPPASSIFNFGTTAPPIPNLSLPTQAQGTQPAVSPSSAVSPPSPNTTGTNGSIPSNAPTLGMHPASVLPGGGGEQQAGPAAPNGSNAPPLGIGQIAGLAVQAGLPADAVRNVGSVYLYDQFRKGLIARPVLEAGLAALGSPAMLQDTGATTRTGMEQAGATTRTGMTEAGATTRTAMDIKEKGREFDTTPRPILGADGKPMWATNATAPGQPIYNESVYQQQQTGQNFVNPDNTVVFDTNANRMKLPPEQRGRSSVGAPDVGFTPATPPGNDAAPAVNTPNLQLGGTTAPNTTLRTELTKPRVYIYTPTGARQVLTQEFINRLSPIEQSRYTLAEQGDNTGVGVIDPRTKQNIQVPASVANTGAFQIAPRSVDEAGAQGLAQARGAAQTEQGVPALTGIVPPPPVQTFTSPNGQTPAATTPMTATPDQPGQAGATAPPAEQPQAPFTPGGTKPYGALNPTAPGVPDGTTGKDNASGQNVYSMGGFWYPEGFKPLSSIATSTQAGANAALPVTGTGAVTDQNEVNRRNFVLNQKAAARYPAADIMGTRGEFAALPQAAKVEINQRVAAMARTDPAVSRNWDTGVDRVVDQMIAEGKLPASLDRSKQALFGVVPGVGGVTHDPNVAQAQSLNPKITTPEHAFMIPYSPTGAFRELNKQGKPINKQLHDQLGGK